MSRPTAIFLDRDGTVIHDAHFLARPEQLELLPGAAAAIRRVNEVRIPVILVTNQSGIGRGLFSDADYARVHARLEQLLGEFGARLDASYYCPHAPDTVPRCACRKPASGMFRQAARVHRLDMQRPAFVGDRWRDVAAVDELGGTRLLVRSPRTTDDDLARAAETGTPTLASLADAVDHLLGLR